MNAARRSYFEAAPLAYLSLNGTIKLLFSSRFYRDLTIDPDRILKQHCSAIACRSAVLVAHSLASRAQGTELSTNGNRLCATVAALTLAPWLLPAISDLD